MSHDLEDLLNLIKELEERITALEKTRVIAKSREAMIHGDDAWYWEHG